MRLNRVLWVVAIGLGVVACKAKEATSETPPTPGSADLATSTTAVARATKDVTPTPSGDCENQLEYLLPPQKYENGDLIRAIVADADHVYFRNFKQVYSMPSTGGEPTVISQGPGLSLSGRTAFFTSGEHLLTQSASEPIFMASPKAGGDWKTIIDLTSRKLGGGRDGATRILQGLGRSSTPSASEAVFDGSSFYWAETTRGKGANAPSTSRLRSVGISEAAAKTLYQTAGDVGDVAKAGDRIVFMHTGAPSAEQLEQQAAAHSAKHLAFAPRGERHLMSVAVAGGEAKTLARISHFVANVVLGTDGSSVYVSGYADEDVAKPGIYRVDGNGSTLEQLDKRVLHGRAFVVGNNVIVAGDAQIEPGASKRGQVVLSMPHGGKSFSRLACITEGYSAHAYAVAGNNLLISLFKSDTQMASIAKIPLP